MGVEPSRAQGTRNLAGRVAIVTGGARGLGRAYCVKLAEAAATIVVADILDGTPIAKEIEQRG